MTAFRATLVTALALLAGAAGAYVLVLRDDAPSLPPMSVETITADPDVPLAQQLEVEPSTDGCPGYSVQAPAGRVIGAPGSGSRALTLDSNGSALVLTCMGETSSYGDLESFVAKKIAEPSEYMRTLRMATEVHSPYGRAIRTESIMGTKSLTEWFTERGGKTWGVGYVHPVDDASELATVEAVLASWSWS